MATKLSDKDEVALLMQQQGLSRVQATKLIYEMAKQKKKEEASSSAGSKGFPAAQPAVPQDASIVKKNVERFSSLKDMTPYIPSMIHEDVDLTSERPTLKLDAGTSFRYTNGGVSSVNVMAASLDSRSNKSIQEPKKDADDQDDDETEVVTPFDEDKFSESLQSLEVPLDDSELSPTAIAGGSLVTPPARRRSSNSALNLRPLARLHPGKFQKDGQALNGTGGEEDDNTPPPEIEYQSGNSSDAEEWEEPVAKPAPPQFKPPTLAAPAKAAEAAAPTPPVVVAAKPSLASKLLQPVAPKAAEPVLAPPVTAAAPVAPKISPTPPAPPVLSNPLTAPVSTREGSSATTGSNSTSTTTSSESKTFSSNTTTTATKIVSSAAVPAPVAAAPAPTPAAPLPLEERVALLNSGKAEASASTATTSAASADAPSSPVPTSAARANEVLNVKVGNKKLTVRASFTAGNAGGSIAAAAAAAAASADLPPPPAYVPNAAPPPAYDAPPPDYASPPKVVPPALAERALPPAPVPASSATLKRPSIPPVQSSAKSSTSTSSASLSAEVSKITEVAQHASSTMTIKTEAAYLAPTPLSDVEEEDEGEEEETGTAEERIAKMMAKYRRKSYMKKDSPVGAFKDLTPVDDAEIGRLMYLEQKEREAAVKAQKPAVNGSISSNTTNTTASATSTIIETEILAAPAPQMVAAVMNKDSTDLVEELISQGYSRENAITLAKEIELDRRGERFHTRHAAPPPFPDTPNGYRNGGPPRSGASVTSHTSSINHNFRERSSFDRSFNDDDAGSVVSNISGVSRASSYCESDKLLMNLLLSQQKGKYGVNMYESLTNHDEVAIERYMAKGSTLDQAVLKVFEKKYGSVDNQVLPKSVYGTSNGMSNGGSGAAKQALNGEEALEIVDTMHAEIELLMLSGGYSRDVAVKMLLSKVAKEKALQAQAQQQSVGGLMAAENEHHLHKAASMSSMMPQHHNHHEAEAAKQYNSTAHTQQQTHTLHSSRSMYTMPSNASGVASGGSSRSRPEIPPLAGFPNQYGNGAPSPRTQEGPYSPQYPQAHGNFPPPLPSPRSQEPAFPTQYPPTHSSTRQHGSSFDAGSQPRRRPSGSNMSVASGIASVNSASGRISHISATSAGSRTQDDRDYIPALLREQEAAFGINMYEYLAPDDPEVARLMSQFNFTKIDAMIAVFRQFPPQVGAGPRRPEQDSSRLHRGAPAPRPGPPGPSNGRPAPKPAAATAAYNEEEELQRVMRLSMMDHENVPGAVAVPGLGASNQRPAWSAPNHAPPPSGGAGYRQASNMDIMSLVQMGFTAAQAQDALARHNFDVHQAANYLLGGL